MLYYRNESNAFDYELEDIIKLFFLQSEIRKSDQPWDIETEAFLLCSAVLQDAPGKEGSFQISLRTKDSSEVSEIPMAGIAGQEDRQKLKAFKRILKRRLFQLLHNYTQKEIPWGIMTGIRPAKLVNELLNEGRDRGDILSVLEKDYFVTAKKAELLYQVAANQRALFLDRRPDHVSLYIGIPFCPTRCLYCSFSSSTLAQYKGVVDIYVDTLLKEIQAAARLIEENHFNIESIYIGGGTPTSLNAAQLSRLLKGIESCLNLRHIREYTLEAGRPDTIDTDRLKVIRDSGVTRISINPQTMDSSTLERIGRQHTAEDIEKAYHLAREMGFGNINMDLICGLPGENSRIFRNTLEKVAALNPDSLTVHTMSIKRASRLTEERQQHSLTEQYAEAAGMVELAGEYAAGMGLNPYYLYRQKNILGNLENVGYSRAGKECIYNIQMMEERQTILACGAGAVTKVVFPGNRIERSFNVKSVEEYIGRIDEMIERKRKVIDNH